MATRVEKHPYDVGRPSAGWYLFLIILLALIALGLYAYGLQLTEGETVTGMRDIGTMGGAPWGLYVAFVVYFIGASFAGITVAALIRLFNLEPLKPVARMAELLTVITIVLGAFSILADVGQPLRAIVNLLRYARPQSPFYGTFALVISGYLFASVVYLYLDGRHDAAISARIPGRFQWLRRLWAAGYHDTPGERQRHERASFWLAIAILPLLVTAHSTLGFVFGLQVGRPGWFSALQAPAFVILAGISGVGLLILIAAILRQVLGEKERLSPDAFRWLGSFLMVLIAAYIYFMVVEWLTAIYAGHHHEVRVTTALLTGEFAWLYWLSVAFLAIPFVLLLRQFVLRRYDLPMIVLSGVMVNLAAIGKRYLIVVPSQTHGNLLPYASGSYAPTWVEYSIIMGLFALGTLLYALFVKVFPILPVVTPGEGGAR